MSTTVTEYVCQDCGTLLRHTNPTTLESMRDVHNQLCIVKRQKTMAAQVAAQTCWLLQPYRICTLNCTSAVFQQLLSHLHPQLHQPCLHREAAAPTTISLTGTGSTQQSRRPNWPQIPRKRQVTGTLSRNQGMGANWPARTIGYMGSSSMQWLWRLRCRRSMYWSLSCQCIRMAWNARSPSIWQKGFHGKRKGLHILYGMWKRLSASGNQDIHKRLGKLISQLILPVT